jgi:hypothetical protein
LADDLGRWLENKPIVARRPSWRKRLEYWARRHGRVATAGVTLLATLVVLTVAGLVYWQQQRAALAAAVQEDLQEVVLAIEQDRWTEGWRPLDRAEARLAGGGPAWLREQVHEQRRNLMVLAKLDEAKLKTVTTWDTTRVNYYPTPQEYVAAFNMLAHVALSHSPSPESDTFSGHCSSAG